MNANGEDVQHAPVVFGPVRAGDLTISGVPYEEDGYGWTCSCGQSEQGFRSEAVAETSCTLHVPPEQRPDQRSLRERLADIPWSSQFGSSAASRSGVDS